jgi:hypothetical protein
MIPLHPQFVSGSNQGPTVVLTLPEWERILEALEELDDIRAYDQAHAGSQESVPFEQAVRELGEGYDA